MISDVPRSSYEPPEDAADLFARHKEAVDTQADLKQPLREMAVREMRKGSDGGATVTDLARLTGLSAEYFRKIAREEDIPLRRPPTVRRLGDD